MSADQKLASCPLCGMEVDQAAAEEIEQTMESENKSCAGCGRTFWEAREEEGLS